MSDKPIEPTMKIVVEKEGKEYFAEIYIGGELVYQKEHKTRELACLDGWENSLIIRDIATATKQSILELTGSYEGSYD